MSYYPQASVVHPSAYSQGAPMAPVQVVPSMVPNGMAVPMNGGMAQVPMAGYGYPAYPAYPYNPYSLGNRFRRFFGLAPANVRYRSDRGTWGFMGYSRRQRYLDARTGMEVDRHGRPIYRV